MFSNFGHKWICCLQRGPGFAYNKDEGQDLSISQSTSLPVCEPDSSSSSPEILQQAWQETQTGDGIITEVHAESPANATYATNIECVPEAREEGLVENLVNVIGDLVIESPVESDGLAQVSNQVETGNREPVGNVLEVEETVVGSDVSDLLDQVNVENTSYDHSVSYLWARFSTDEREDDVNGDNPADLAQLHGICPQPPKKKAERCRPNESKS